MDGYIVDLKLGQERLSGDIALLRSQQGSNHQQNRNDIHDLRDTTQTLVDDVGEIKIKFARLGGYAAGAGAVAALIAHFIDKIWR
jgi:hypothetical protein